VFTTRTNLLSSKTLLTVVACEAVSRTRPCPSRQKRCRLGWRPFPPLERVARGEPLAQRAASAPPCASLSTSSTGCTRHA